MAQGLYDIHGAGMGAAPRRDGVNTCGHMNIPSAGISDIERIEMQYPFLYFTRSHNCDGSGFGQYRGGMGSYRIYLIYGSKDCSVDYKPYGGVAQGGFGLSGGYPTGFGANRVMIEAGLEMLDKVRKGEHPTGQTMRAGEWGKSFLPAGVPERIPLPGRKLAGRLRSRAGGGFGDSIDRAPQAVLKDFGRGWVSRETAERVYGVILSDDGKAVNDAATERRRQEIRESRKQSAAPVSGKTSSLSASGRNGWRQTLRFHATLEVCTNGKQKAIRALQSLRPFVLRRQGKLQALRLASELTSKGRSCRPYPRGSLISASTMSTFARTAPPSCKLTFSLRAWAVSRFCGIPGFSRRKNRRPCFTEETPRSTESEYS